MVHVSGEGFLLGLSAGGFCLSACAPVFIPYLLAESASSFKKLLWQITQFLAGRLTAYITFAVIAGFLSGRLKYLITPKVTGVSIILTALILLFYSMVKNAPQLGLCKKYTKSTFLSNIPFLLGFLMGMHICPPMLIGIARIAEMGSIYMSVIFFVFFFIGTSLYLLPLLFLKPAFKHEKASSIGKLASIIAGIYFLITGIARLI